MSKYKKLMTHLQSIEGDAWEVGFTEIEEILGFPLPRSAYQYPAWWSNQEADGHSQTVAWQSIGWRTAELSLKAQRITFCRSVDNGRPEGTSSSHDVQPRQGLSIVEAKTALATYFGIKPENIEITIRG